MNDSITEQLTNLRSQIKTVPNIEGKDETVVPKLLQGGSNSNLEEHWSGVFAQAMKGSGFGQNTEKLPDQVESRTPHIRTKSEEVLRLGVLATLAAFAGSCMFMVKKQCTNEDKGAKFKL